MGLFNLFELLPPRATKHTVSFALTNLPCPACHRTNITRSACSAMPPMPLEIILQIMENACADEQPESNTQLLVACALVCRQWSTAAQKLLFRHVSLRSQASFEAFRAAVDRSTEHGRILGDAVMGIRVVLDHNQPSGLTQSSFAHAITLCPNLADVNLSVYGCGSPGADVMGSPDASRMARTAPSFDEETLSLLKLGPAVSSLQLNNWSDNAHTITQLLDVWPTVQSVVLSGNPPELPSSSEPFPGRLRELHLNFQTSPSAEFLEWLLHNSAETLRVLRIEREPLTGILDYMLDAHGKELESLSLPSCHRRHFSSLQSCERLKEFCIEDCSSGPGMFKCLPQDLEHIAFTLDKNTPMISILEAVKARPSLKSITAHSWHDGEFHKHLTSLQMACAYRGIELRMTKDIKKFRAVIHG